MIDLMEVFYQCYGHDHTIDGSWEFLVFTHFRSASKFNWFNCHAKYPSNDCLSSSTYNKLWADAQVELNSLLTQEFPAQPPRPEKDRVVFFQRLATLYVRYVQIFRQLEEAYDQVVHPQKRKVIREVLDGVMGRVLELKNEMVEKEFSEYHYMDDVIQDLKLTPVSSPPLPPFC